MNKESIEKALNTLAGKVYEPSEIGKVLDYINRNKYALERGCLDETDI